jgi:hypothetical protein
MIIQTKFESNDRNTKKMNQNIDEKLENIEDSLKIRQKRFEANKQRHPHGYDDFDDNQQQYDDTDSLKERFEDIPKRSTRIDERLDAIEDNLNKKFKYIEKNIDIKFIKILEKIESNKND